MTTPAQQAAEAVAEKAIEVSGGVTLDEDQKAVEEAALPIIQAAIDAATAELVKERDRYREALKAIAAHQELIGGVTGARISAAHRIASEALELPTPTKRGE